MIMDAAITLDGAAKETARIEFFSDAVFAIAITLLVLDIHVPEMHANESLVGALGHEWPSFLALLVGFFTLLICWINHHHMFTMIHRSDSILMLMNGFKLLVVTLTPFATAVLSKHIGTPWQHAAVSIYCLNFALMGTAMTGLWSYAYAKGFAKAPARVLRANTRLYIGACLFATAIWLVSFVSIVACLALSAVMFMVFVSPQRASTWLLRDRR
jgi:TMEM175 potassium channel family protein